LTEDDIAGSSDPFCEVYVDKERTFITAVKKKTLSPVWNERVILELPRDNESLKIVSILVF